MRAQCTYNKFNQPRSISLGLRLRRRAGARTDWSLRRTGARALKPGRRRANVRVDSRGLACFAVGAQHPLFPGAGPGAGESLASAKISTMCPEQGWAHAVQRAPLLRLGAAQGRAEQSPASTAWMLR